MNPVHRFAAALGMIALVAGCATAPPTTETAAAAAPAPVVIGPAATPLPPTPVEAVAPAAVVLPPKAVVAAAPAHPPSRRLLLAGDAYGEREDLWQRLRDGFAMPDLEGDALVGKWEQWYASRPEYVQRMAERGGRYLFHIVEEVQRRGLPTELALLPFIESAFNPQAMSSARASGMWQFMPATGRDFELKQNLFRDDRRDVLASTRAALDYLQKLESLFGDWRLALAAYNWGQGNVQKAITRNQKAGLPADYANLRMPDETRNYLPKLQAVKNIVTRPGAFSLALPALENHPFFASVPIERDIDVALAAQFAGISVDDFRQLNPQLNKPVILAKGTPQVLLPWDNAERFRLALVAHASPMASWSAWTTKQTLRPDEMARRIGMPEAQLRELNLIPPRMLVKAGSTLLVPRDAQTVTDVSSEVADNAAMLLQPEGPPLRRVTIHAGTKGESVVSVAKRHGLSAMQVAQWNDVGLQAVFKAGQSILLMLPARTAGPRAAAPAAARPSSAAPRKALPAAQRQRTRRQ